MKSILLSLMIIIVIFGCAKPDGDKSGLEKKQETEFQTSKEEARKIPVIVQDVKLRNLEQYIRITGKTEGITDIVMTCETSGKVISVNKILGDRVEKGDEIGSVENEDAAIMVLQAEASVLASEASYETADLQMQASERLYKNEMISQAEYLQTKSNFKNYLAGLNSAKAGAEQAKRAYANSKFISPVSGYIADIKIEVGEAAAFGQPICSIVDYETLLIKTGIGENEIQKLNKGQKVKVVKVGNEKEFIGSISGIGIKPINDTSLYPIEISVKNNTKNELLPGMVVETKILSRTFKDVIYTSMNNIIQEYDERFVFVTAAGKAERKKVILGAEVGENVVIISGINVGDRLVTDGKENLETGTVTDIRKGL